MKESKKNRAFIESIFIPTFGETMDDRYNVAK